MARKGVIASYLLYIKLIYYFIVYAFSFIREIKKSIRETGKPVYAEIPRYGKHMLEKSGIPVATIGSFPKGHPRPFVIMPNHSSIFDLFLSALMTDGQPVTACIADWAYALTQPIFKPFKAIPLSRSNTQKDIDQLKNACNRLKEERIHLIGLPEGTRTKTGNMLPFKSGLFYMACDLGYDILPVYFIGAYEVKPKNRHVFVRRPITVVYGKPIETAGFSDPKALRDFVQKTMHREYKKLREKYL